MQLLVMLVVLIASLLGLTPRAAAAQSARLAAGAAQRAADRVAERAAVDPAAAARLKSAGRGASLTVLPARLGGKAMLPAGEAVALLLERAGMTKLVIEPQPWEAPAEGDLSAIAAALGDRVRAAPPATDFVLFVDIVGVPGTGITELRAVIVDKQGKVAWLESLAKGSKAFDRAAPHEPLECCILLAKELAPTLSLAEPTRADAPEGPVARRFREASGVPDDAELAAIQARGAKLRAAARTATIVVYPACAGGELSADSAAAIAAALQKQGFAGVRAASKGPTIEAPRVMNEQTVLWTMAHAFRDRMRAEHPDADYAVFADYVMGRFGVAAVHFAVCDRAGELVLVDYQNSHHEDFCAVAPQDRAGADALVVRRFVERAGK
jgi:hypothetical protein